MTDYQKYINALRKCAKEHENDRTSFGHIIVADLCRDTANLLETLEQEPNTGYWIYSKDINTGEIRWSECSVCGNGEIGCAKRMKYCPNCGIKMDNK